MRRSRSGLCGACLAALLTPPSAAAGAGPAPSWDRLTTGDGRGFAVVDLAPAGRVGLSALFARPFRHPAEGQETPDLLAGVGPVSFAVRDLTEDRPLSAEPLAAAGYVDEGHVIRLVQRVGGGPLSAATYVLAVWGDDEPGVALLLELTNRSESAPRRHVGVRLHAPGGPRWEAPLLAPGESRWFGVAGLPGAWRDVPDPAALLAAERAAWEAWRAPSPPGLAPTEERVWRQCESVLRMAQVREASPFPAAPGAVLASLPPGSWWIAWVRDMAYALVALAGAGHGDEARAGVRFWEGAEAGRYADLVGTSYPVSVVRYFGDGGEETDFDAHGPNLEFDGFALAAWAARASGDATSPLVRRAADTLLALRDPQTGLILPDSSIWEVHWDGRQRRFAYTSIAAARALCDAGRPEAARDLRDAVLAHLVDPATGALGQSWEDPGVADGAVVEAINFGLVAPDDPVAAATVDRLAARLTVPSGGGLARNEAGGGYDSHEWVFIDLRLASALRRVASPAAAARADALLDRVTLFAAANHGLIPELLHPRAATYRGAVPMVGFGAGAYMLALLDRESPADEPHLDACFGPAPP